MATKKTTKKPEAKKPAAPAAKRTIPALQAKPDKAKLDLSEVPTAKVGGGGQGFGAENHAMRTIAWAVDLGLVPKSVQTDAARASRKSELIEAMERVRTGCEGFGYSGQVKAVDEIIKNLKRSGS